MEKLKDFLRLDKLEVGDTAVSLAEAAGVPREVVLSCADKIIALRLEFEPVLLAHLMQIDYFSPGGFPWLPVSYYKEITDMLDNEYPDLSPVHKAIIWVMESMEMIDWAQENANRLMTDQILKSQNGKDTNQQATEPQGD